MFIGINNFSKGRIIDSDSSGVADNGWGMQGGVPNGIGGNANPGMGGLGGNQGNQGNKTSTQVTIPKEVRLQN